MNLCTNSCINVSPYRFYELFCYSCIDSFGKLIAFSSVNSFNLKERQKTSKNFDSAPKIRTGGGFDAGRKSKIPCNEPHDFAKHKKTYITLNEISFGKCFHERDDGIWITAAGSRLYRNWPPCRPWQPANRMLWSECSPGKCLHQYTNPTMTLLHTLATVMLLQIQTTNKKHSNILPTSLEYCWNFRHRVCFHK